MPDSVYNLPCFATLRNTSFYIVHYKTDFVHGNFSVNEVGIYDIREKFCSWSYM